MDISWLPAPRDEYILFARPLPRPRTLPRIEVLRPRLLPRPLPRIFPLPPILILDFALLWALFNFIPRPEPKLSKNKLYRSHEKRKIRNITLLKVSNLGFVWLLGSSLKQHYHQIRVLLLKKLLFRFTVSYGLSHEKSFYFMKLFLEANLCREIVI